MKSSGRNVFIYFSATDYNAPFADGTSTQSWRLL